MRATQTLEASERAPSVGRKLVVMLAAVAICVSRAGAAQLPVAGGSQIAEGAEAPQPDIAGQFDRMREKLSQSEAQLAASQQQIRELRQELDSLEQQMRGQGAAPAPSGSAVGSGSSTRSDETSSSSAASFDELRERQTMQQAEIMTHEQSKVETESKFPFKLTGTVLFNGFVNSRQVDLPITPVFALSGIGSTGASLRQTALGFRAHGPHLFGARSSADLDMDFYGSGGTASYGAATGLLRLRTAHAALEWNRAELFFNLDRPILSPETPTSLTSVALPALAWSGDLWAWNPQFGLRYSLPANSQTTVRFEAALIDPADPPNAAATAPTTAFPYPSWAESSRRPGVEAHVSLLHAGVRNGGGSSGAGESKTLSFGIGGYVSRHLTPAGTEIDAWAGTLDYRLPLPARLQLTGSAFRGAALGGLGAGAFKDFVTRSDATGIHTQVLDDVGGWTQLKQRVTERWEWNAAYGIDNVFAGQLRPFAIPNLAAYTDLARNRTVFTNVIYTPSSALAFSFEYRHLASSPVNAPTSSAAIYGAAAAYKF